MKRIIMLITFCLCFFACSNTIKTTNINSNKNKIIPIEYREKIGFVNQDLQIIVLPEYDKLVKYNVNCFLLRKAQQNIQNNYLLLDNGNIISLDKNEKICFIGNNYFALMPYFITKSNLSTRIYNIYDLNNPYVFENIQVRDSVSINNIQVINPFLEELPRYFLINIQNEKKLLSNNYKEIVQIDEKEDFAVIKLDNFYYTIIDLYGNRLTEKDFFKLARIGNGLILGELNKETGYYDKKGNLIIPVEITNDQDISCCPIFTENVLPCIYENEKITVQETDVYKYSNHWAIINSKGNFVAKNIVADYISNFSSDGVAVMNIIKDGHNDYYLINSKGKVLNQIPFDYISESINGYSRAKKGNIDYIISTKDGKSYKVFEFLVKMKGVDF